MFTMTYHGAQKVVNNYSIMGPVKAALEESCRYLACELGPKKIRVHAISPGPLKTSAACGLNNFDMCSTRRDISARGEGKAEGGGKIRYVPLLPEVAGELKHYPAVISGRPNLPSTEGRGG